MNILAVDATSERGGVAIRSAGKALAEVSRHAPDGFAHVLFSLIEEALATANLKLSDIDCFAAASGPGSFTGVRVGLSAVKGLAEALGKPAVGVSNLKAMALSGTGALRAVILDARRNQAYVAVYDDQLRPVAPEEVVNLSEWLANLVPVQYEFIGLEGSGFKPAGNLAAAVAEIAERSQWSDPAALDANYVRRSDAELFWKEVG
ncbi:MAG TPA: tRNA (adenosine(37)-N6)-threonylcarbamoyltransferase complex dimerization subunit type 1 TsaB [Bryobacteraceae bacterium]|nr:tRNA (adenosine(37)-N6)-threonylcarbamoyltransferase complex dimerization subunit type 1 TsaB [Bryobacteraceae bacterium]